MRSVVALAALALTGTLQVVGAKKCSRLPSSNPDSNVSSGTTSTQSTPTGSIGSSAVDTSSGATIGTTSSTSPTSAAETSASSSINSQITPTTAFSTPSITPGTPTSLLTTLTQTDGTVVVTNVVENGNFAQNVGGFTTSGSGVTYDATDGYTGDNSNEKGCAKLEVTGSSTGNAATTSTLTNPPVRRHIKRQAGVSDLVTISQNLVGLDVNTQYTLRFYYKIITGSTTPNDCRLLASFNDQAFWSAFIMQPDQSPTTYIEVVQQTLPPQANSALKFSLRCDFGGSVSVLIDSIFLSNKVTPATINQYILDYGSSDGTVPVSSFSATTQTSTTSALPPLRTNECGQRGTAGNGLSSTEFAAYGGSKASQTLTQRKCIELCQNAYQYCGAVSYNDVTSECHTYNGTPAQIGFEADSSSPTSFYSNSCLKQDKFDECGTMGSVAAADRSNPYYIGSFGPQVQPVVCYQVCVGINMGCVTFGWDATTGICQLYKGTREQSGFTPATRSAWTYYSRDCFA